MAMRRMGTMGRLGVGGPIKRRLEALLGRRMRKRRHIRRRTVGTRVFKTAAALRRGTPMAKALALLMAATKTTATSVRSQFGQQSSSGSVRITVTVNHGTTSTNDLARLIVQPRRADVAENTRLTKSRVRVC